MGVCTGGRAGGWAGGRTGGGEPRVQGFSHAPLEVAETRGLDAETRGLDTETRGLDAETRGLDTETRDGDGESWENPLFFSRLTSWTRDSVSACKNLRSDVIHMYRVIQLIRSSRYTMFHVLASIACALSSTLI